MDVAHGVSDLPDELQGRILYFLCAAEMGRAATVSTLWAALADYIAEHRACELLSVPRRMPSDSVRPSWLRALATCEALIAGVGEKPVRGWRSEWVPLHLESLRLRSVRNGREEDFKLIVSKYGIDLITQEWQPNGRHCIERELNDVSVSVAWKVSQGWPQEQAEAYTLIASHFKAALGLALRSGSAAYAASTHLLCTTLSDRAWQLQAPAPDCFKDLGGSYGLCQHDPAWEVLRTVEPPSLGTALRTSAMLEASASPSCLSPDGFCTPVNIAGHVEYQQQDSDIVCFHSLPCSSRGFHSLVPTAQTEDEVEYDLPPLSTVTLQRVEGPGTWQAFGITVNRRLLVVTVQYAFP